MVVSDHLVPHFDEFVDLQAYAIWWPSSQIHKLKDFIKVVFAFIYLFVFCLFIYDNDFNYLKKASSFDVSESGRVMSFIVDVPCLARLLVSS